MVEGHGHGRVPASPLLVVTALGTTEECQPHPSPGGGCTQDHRGVPASPPLVVAVLQGHGGAASLPPPLSGGCTLRTLDLGGTLAVTWSEALLR